jgi:uncharacterized repeat protein (TIGR01451 family)
LFLVSGRQVLVAVLLIGLLIGPDPPSMAETNSAVGGIGGLNNGTLSGGDGTGTAQITLHVEGLALVKRARDLAGRVLPDGSAVAAGQVIYFVLTVQNPTLYPAEDVRITDLLDRAQFEYVVSSLEEARVPSGTDDAALWAATWRALTDDTGPPDDIASIAQGATPTEPDRITVGDVPGQQNLRVRIEARTTLAVRFRVRVR